MDEGNREGLAVEPDISVPSARVVRIPEERIAVHGRPAAFWIENGLELTAEHFVSWCASQGIAIHRIQPGKSNQRAYIECFNRRYRTEVLDADLYESILEVRKPAEEWLKTYNCERPHDSLGQAPPLTFLPRPQTAGESTFGVST
jgi:putative transposase